MTGAATAPGQDAVLDYPDAMPAGKPTYVFGSFRLDTLRRVLTRDGEPVPLTSKVFDTLQLLVEHAGEVRSKESLMQDLWPDTTVEESNLTQNVSVLRKALGESRGEHRYIVTVPGRGYQFVAEVRREAPAGTAAADGVQIPAILQRKRAAAVVGLVLVLAMAVTCGVYLARPPHAITSIAVLPFRNLSGDDAVEYLSDGLAESLIDRLSQLPGVKVVARSSSFQYKSRHVDIREVARSLGVEAVLEGDITRRDDEVQVRVDLVDGAARRHLWGERYQRKSTSLQSVQEDIARSITDKLHVRLTAAQQKQFAKRVTENPEAYRLYLTGLLHERRNTSEETKRALEYYNQAVTLDPKFALAFANMTDAYSNLASAGVIDRPAALAKAKAAALKAVQLDGTLAEGHGALAVVKLQEWDWPGAENEFRRAIELNPNLSGVHSDYAIYLTITGRFDDALASNRRAQELDPLGVSYKAHEGRILAAARRYDSAIRVLLAALEMKPDEPSVHVGLAQAYGGKQMYAEAIREYREVLKLYGDIPPAWIDIACAYTLSGNRSEGVRILKRLNATKNARLPLARMAALYAVLGDHDAALDRLERAHAARDPALMNLKISPAFDSLRPDPRFQAIVRRIGLSP